MTCAYDKIYLERARMTLGSMTDFAVNVLGYNLRDFWNAFLVSDISRRFAKGESSVLVGKSGVELAYAVLNPDNVCKINAPVSANKSPEYWAGWALAYYQWSSNLSFAQIDKAVPVENIVRMYFPYHEMDIRQFCDRMNELTNRGNAETKLKARRKLLGLTQKELAEESGVPLRTLQQYEQGQKSINGARSEYVTAFARALYCSPEELLEQTGETPDER